VENVVFKKCILSSFLQRSTVTALLTKFNKQPFVTCN